MASDDDIRKQHDTESLNQQEQETEENTNKKEINMWHMGLLLISMIFTVFYKWN